MIGAAAVARGRIEATAVSTQAKRAAPPDPWRLLRSEHPSWATTPTADPRLTQRWVTFRAVLGQVVRELLADWGLTVQEPTDNELRGGNVLDGKPHRLEDGDGPRVTRLQPLRFDRPDLDEVGFPA